MPTARIEVGSSNSKLITVLAAPVHDKAAKSITFLSLPSLTSHDIIISPLILFRKIYYPLS
jgi:hypothetical protein